MQSEELAKALGTYVNRRRLRVRRETNSDLIHRSLTKQGKQHMTHRIFNCEFGTLHIVGYDFTEPMSALYLHQKHAHSRFLSFLSIDLHLRFKYTEEGFP
jgi:hypothetical protein